MLETISLDKKALLPDLYTSVQYLKGVGPERAKILSKLGIHTIEDLLCYFPIRYIDRSQIRRIGSVNVGEEATIAGVIESVKPRRRRWQPLEVIVADDSG